MDPLMRKLFQPREAREKLRGMGGIMSSSPQLASTVAKFHWKAARSVFGAACRFRHPAASRGRPSRYGRAQHRRGAYDCA
jgi:hypothetical protein